MDGEALPHVRFDQPMPAICFLGGLVHAQLVADAPSMFITRAMSSWFAFMSNAVPMLMFSTQRWGLVQRSAS